MTPESVARTLARLYPRDASASEELTRAVGYLGLAVEPAVVVRAGYGAGLVAGAVGAILAVGAGAAIDVVPPRGTVVGLGYPFAAIVGLGVGLVAVHAVHAAPLLLARVRRTRALGDAPGLIGRVALRLRIEPSPERAARFAARTGEGPLAASLDDHVRRAAGTPESGLGDFAAAWREWFPALDRAAALVTAAADAPPAERDRILGRATSAVLDGSRDRMADFAGDVRAPATGVYAFGVLLPLALVGVLPAARVAGVGLPTAAFVAVYDVLLPLALLGACVRLLSRRPVAFPPPRVTRDHPAVPNRPWTALVAGLAAGIAAWTAVPRLVAWAGPVAAVGAGAGTALVVRTRPIKAVRDRVREVEADLPDALALVGRRVAEGEAVEAAVARVGAEAPGVAGETFADAARVQRTLRVGVREAFLGDCGALADVPSPRARGAASVLALAASEGRPAGTAIVALAEQLDDLRAVEREARRELSAVTGTLANTAAVFAPLVGGATVALADGMARHGADAGLDGRATGATAPATADLGVAVGAYVLLLAVLLTALSIGLERGLDRSLIGYRSGWALLTATATYLTAFVGAGLLF